MRNMRVICVEKMAVEEPFKVFIGDAKVVIGKCRNWWMEFRKK
jgi:hypothetical protein